MSEFVQDDVIANRSRGLHQAPVQRNRAAPRARPPARALIAHHDLSDFALMRRRQFKHARRQFAFRQPPKMPFHRRPQVFGLAAHTDALIAQAYLPGLPISPRFQTSQFSPEQYPAAHAPFGQRDRLGLSQQLFFSHAMFLSAKRNASSSEPPRGTVTRAAPSRRRRKMYRRALGLRTTCSPTRCGPTISQRSFGVLGRQGLKRNCNCTPAGISARKVRRRMENADIRDFLPSPPDALLIGPVIPNNSEKTFMRSEQTEVLVVGAGPAGLLTALLLAEAGVDVSIIDREERTTARSYACALHPRTLQLLNRLQLAAPLLELGRRTSKLAFYDQESRRAEIDLAQLDTEFPFLLILPQSAVESLLEERLRKAGINVQWNHRLDAVQDDNEEVVATVEEMAGTATGYIVPHWEMVVKRRTPVRAQFVIGADGHHSTLRNRLGVESQRVAGPFFFAAYEFESDTPTENEVRVVLDNTTTNVLWPLAGNRGRWTFQLSRSHSVAEFPEKERRAARLSPPTVDEKIREFVERVAKTRAPWFSSGIKSIAWCTKVVFEHRVAKQFGRNRCWLVGDAAHQAGPVGIQSMNVGFCEAEALSAALKTSLHDAAPLNLAETYDRSWQAEWKRLLGLTGGLKTRNDTNPWVRDRAQRILPCLPASDGDLTSLAAQLKLDYP